MPKVLARCEGCGDVELTPADLTVHVWTSDGPGDYAFRCPRCDLDNVSSVEPNTVDLLLASGAAIETWHPRALGTAFKTAPAVTHPTSRTARTRTGFRRFWRRLSTH